MRHLRKGAGITAIRAPEASFARPVTSTLNPIRDGLVGEFVLGGDAATSRRNLTNRPAQGVVNGSPTYGPDSMTFANSSGQSLDTGVKAAMNDATIICVTRGLGSGNGEIVGAFPGNAAGGSRSLTETFKIAPNFGIGALQSETAYLDL